MPIRNHFPVFHKLKAGAYSYVWTDKCERLLPQHYKQRCLDYMLRDPPAVHWKPDPRKYTMNEFGQLRKVQNHPILVKYPVQCNRGLWAGEGIVQCWMRFVKGTTFAATHASRCARLYTPYLVERVLYSEILDKWFRIPCTNRAMDQIDDVFGLDYYILQTHERDINSKLGMDLKREMLVNLAKMSQETSLSEDRQKVFKRYQKFMIPYEEAEWVGLSIMEALEKAEAEIQSRPLPPLKYLIEQHYIEEYKKQKMEGKDTEKDIEPLKIDPELTKGLRKELKSWFISDKTEEQGKGKPTN